MGSVIGGGGGGGERMGGIGGTTVSGLFWDCV